MSNDATKVTAGQPKVGGAAFWAPAGTTLPTAADADLGNTFVCLGYVSEDGVTFSRERESEEVREWGGDVVLSLQTSKTDTAQMTLIEALNENVLKLVHGADNVTGALATGLTVKENSKALDHGVWVIDQILNGDVLMRTIMPDAQVTGLDDVQFARNAAVGYNVTATAYPYADWDGDTHRELYKQS